MDLLSAGTIYTDRNAKPLGLILPHVLDLFHVSSWVKRSTIHVDLELHMLVPFKSTTICL